MIHTFRYTISMALVPNQALQQAAEAHREGRLADAERLYRIILEEHPNHPSANHNLGLLSVTAGNVRESLGFFESALRSDASQLEFWLSYINALLGVGRFDQARKVARQMQRLGFDSRICDALERRVADRYAKSLVDGLVAAFNNGSHGDFRRLGTELIENFPSHYVGWKALGISKLRSHDPIGALESLSVAEKINPSDAETLKYMANAQRSLGLIKEAEASYKAAISRQPNFVEAYHELGTLLISSGRFSEAEALCRTAIGFNPSAAVTYTSLGVALEGLNRPSEARHCFLQATVLAPRDPGIRYNFGRFLQVQGDLEGAANEYRLALEHGASSIQVLINLSETLKDLGKVDDALAICDQAVAKDPTHARAHWNRSLQRLRLGEFRTGWQEYEWRWKYTDFPSRELQLDQPVWLGRESLVGKRILIHAEQGLGDTIHFCRYVKALKDSGATVLFAPQKQLINLMKGMTTECEIVDLSSGIPHFDYHTPLLSLPLAFGTDLTSIPKEIPYLRADPARVDYWERRIGNRGFKIGICWQGSTGHLDRGRSFPVNCFYDMAQIPNVRLISLVKGEDHSQLQSLPEGMKVEALKDEFDQGLGAFLDTAAVMKVCDLVISSDTAVAHLGGALGVPTWVALKSVPDWRWMLQRQDSPWYPSMRLFRQRLRGDWTSVFNEMESAIRSLYP